MSMNDIAQTVRESVYALEMPMSFGMELLESIMRGDVARDWESIADHVDGQGYDPTRFYAAAAEA